MGVSGAGKSTVGRALAEALAWPFQEGDALHPPANVALMRAGVPLTDEDRWPWLAAVAGWIDGQAIRRAPGVITCSALRRSYRQVLTGGRPQVRLVHLQGDRGLIAGRLAGRRGHFMPPALLDSQFATLEAPGSAEGAFVVDVALDVEQQVAAVLRSMSTTPE